MRCLLHADVYKALKPIRRRIALGHALKWFSIAVLAVLGQAMIWEAISFFSPVMGLEGKIAIGGAAVLVVVLALGWLFRPPLQKIIKEGDRYGFHQRLITAYELSQSDDAFAVLQRQDTIEHLKAFNPKVIPIKLPKLWLYAMVGLAASVFIMALLPNPQDDIVAQRLRVREIIDDQLAKMDAEVADKLDKADGIDQIQKQQIKELLEALKKELKQASDYKEAMKAVSKTEESLKQLLEQERANEMAALSQSLGQYDVTEDLSSALKQGRPEDVKASMDRLKSMLQNSSASVEALQSALADAAKAVKSKQLGQQLQATADALSANSADASALDDLQGQLMQMAEGISSDPADLQYMLQQMKGLIAQAAGQDELQVASSGFNNDSNSDNGGLNSGSGSGSENDSGLGNNGSNGGAGVGQSDGDAGGGAGIGSGHTDRDAGYSDYSGAGYGADKPQGGNDSYAESTEYERIYDPTRLGDGGEISRITDKPSASGNSQQFEVGAGIGSASGFIPYNEVFGDYQRQAMDSLERSSIPPNMRELVKEYFSSLAE